MISVKVREVVLDSEQNPLLLLTDMDETMVLPIGIGFWEAQAIVLKLQGHISSRPLTHDLFKTLCHNLNVNIEKVVISDIKESTFYAEIHLKTEDGRELVMDARPSDGVALALTVGCSIYISPNVAASTISLSEIFIEDEDTEDSEPDEGGPHIH